MVCVERCLVQLSTLRSKGPFFNRRESQAASSDPAPFPKKHSPPPAAETPSSFLPASPGRCPSASCGWTGAGWRWALAPDFRRHLFSTGTRVCWCWQGGAEGWKGSADEGGRQKCPLGEEEIKEPEHFHTPLHGNACVHL